MSPLYRKIAWRLVPFLVLLYMQLVARNAKRGAQFTPQGLLKFPMTATRPDDVLLEIRDLLVKLAPAPVNA